MEKVRSINYGLVSISLGITRMCIGLTFMKAIIMRIIYLSLSNDGIYKVFDKRFPIICISQNLM